MAIEIHDAKAIAKLRAAGAAAAGTLAFIGARVAAGVSTADIDRWAREDTARRGGKPSQLGYHGFPGAVCTSKNAVVCHGIPSKDEVLADGDIINCDVRGGKSLKERVGLRSPHHFLLGYEVAYRVVSHSWLNVLLFGNAIVAGLEQSKVLPSANLLIGFELKNTFQIGVGANLSPLKGSEGHTIIAAGWTPRVGDIYTPVHFFFIPDVDGVNRMGVTTGVTF